MLVVAPNPRAVTCYHPWVRSPLGMNTPKCPGAAAPQTTGSVKPCGMEAARAARSCVPEPLSKPELTGSDAVATVSGGSVQPSICRHALPGPPSQGLGMTLFAQSWTLCRDSIDPSVPTELSRLRQMPSSARPAPPVLPPSSAPSPWVRPPL